MNKQINELRLDAGISLLHDEPYLVAVNKSGEIIDPIAGLEKFAQLIVQECLAQVDKVDAMLEDDREKTGAAWVGLAIAKHFGVE